MTLKKSRHSSGINLEPTTEVLSDNGDIQVSIDTTELQVKLDNSNHVVVTNDQTQTLTNKTIDADTNTISNLEVDNLKAGVLNTSTSMIGASDTQIPSALAVKTYVDNGLASQNEASEISYDNTTSGLAATNVQAAIDEVEGRLQTAETDISNHISDTVDAHDASAISFVPVGAVVATDVQSAIAEVDSDLTVHLTDTIDAHDASAISSIPAGNLAATDVQSALNELQSDVDTRATSAALSAHTEASSGVHGVVGSVVGTSDAQALTNKTIDADQNTISNIDNADIKAGANIARSKLASGTAYRLLANNASGVMSENAVLTSTRIPYADANGQLTDSSDLTVTANGVVLGTTKHLELQASTDSSTTGSDASLASFTAGGVRLTNASLTSLANIPAGANGQQVILFNRTGAAITLVDSSNAVGTAANRIYTGTNASISFANNAAFILSYDSTSSRWQVVGGSGSGTGSSELPIEVLMQQTFETASLTDFTQTGLSLPTASNILIKGTKLALLTHQPATSQSFKQTIAVDNKFKGYLSQLSLDIRSTATSGNVTILFRDETNNADIGTSQQITTGSQAISVTTTSGLATLDALTPSQIATLAVGQSVTGSGIPAGTTIASINTSTFVVTLSANATASATVTARFSALPITRNFSFAIPTNCSSISYTVTALQEASSPETYVDDIIIKLAQSANTTTSITVPKNNDTQPSNVGTITIGAVTTPPTKGTVVADRIMSSRVSNRLIAEYQYEQSNSTGATAGSGDYLFSLPSGLSFDSSSISFNTGTLSNASSSKSVVGRGSIFGYGVSRIGDIILIAYDATRFRAMVLNSTESVTTPIAYYPFSSSTYQLNVTASPLGFNFKIDAPIAGWSANETETKTIPLTSSIITTRPDSTLQVATANGYGSVNNKIRRFANIIRNVGFDVSYSDSPTLGGSFTIQTSGEYQISYSDNFSTAADMGISLNTNSPTLSIFGLPASEVLSVTTTGSNNWVATASWSGYLNKGDVVRPHTGGGGAAGTNITTFTISKIGSSSIINPSSDQKIEIPTHELRFENASTRGTIDTAVVKFDTLAKIKGDGFLITNTAANGTIVEVRKKGRISLNVSLYGTTTARYVALSKNQVNLTTVPTQSEYLTAEYTTGTSDTMSATYVGEVEVGDKIRVISNTPINADGTNIFNVHLQENSVQVALQNVSPYWDSSNSAVRVGVGNGFGSTNTQVRRYTNVYDNLGPDVTYTDSATLGGSFLINTTDVYNLFATDQNSGTTSYDILITKNKTSHTPVDSNILASSSSSTVSTSLINVSASGILLQKGDVIRVMVNSPANVLSSSLYSTLVISKVGKTQGTVDVTPFVNIPTTNTDYVTDNLSGSSTLYGSTNTGVVYLQATKTSNNGVLKVVSNSVNGSYIEALADADVNMVISAANTNGSQAYITINSTVFVAGAPTGAVAQLDLTSSYNPMVFVGRVYKGDRIRIQRGAIGAGVWYFNTLSIMATAQSTSVVTQTQQVSSDTMNFVFKSTAITDSDPIGTFNTYTYAVNSNTATLSPSAPTQTTSSMNTSGIRIFGRAYNAASTSATPARVEIKIGKGFKSNQVDAFLDTAKSDSVTYDIQNATSTATWGTTVTYSPVTGILALDAGLNPSNSVTTRLVGLSVSSNLSASNAYFVFNASTTPSLVSIPNLQQRVAYLSDVKPSGTAGGSSVIGTQTRTLNTIVDNTGIVTSLASNQFTLPAGTYQIEASAPGYNTGLLKARVRNITDSTTAIIGSSEYTHTTSVAGSMRSVLVGEITITTSKTFELQMYTGGAQATNGLGVAAVTGESEVYSQVKITKIK